MTFYKNSRPQATIYKNKTCNGYFIKITIEKRLKK